jgi:hypothetical protein
MLRRLILLVPLALAVSAAAPPRRDNLDAAARDYVRLQLAIGEKEDGYIDAYYGPETLKTEGKAIAARSNLAQLKGQAEALRNRVDRLGKGAAPAKAQRARFLLSAADCGGHPPTHAPGRETELRRRGPGPVRSPAQAQAFG